MVSCPSDHLRLSQYNSMGDKMTKTRLFSQETKSTAGMIFPMSDRISCKEGE
jgi:hypothetical protein